MADDRKGLIDTGGLKAVSDNMKAALAPLKGLAARVADSQRAVQQALERLNETPKECVNHEEFVTPPQPGRPAGPTELTADMVQELDERIAAAPDKTPRAHARAVLRDRGFTGELKNKADRLAYWHKHRRR